MVRRRRIGAASTTMPIEHDQAGAERSRPHLDEHLADVTSTSNDAIPKSHSPPDRAYILMVPPEKM
jgi:hypothetical protein